MKKKIISIAVIVIAVGLSVCAWFMLPPVVAVQIGLDGQATNTCRSCLPLPSLWLFPWPVLW